MFIDRAKITVKAGDGGDGVVRFRREKYVAHGGPDGGDGGRGGSIILKTDPGMDTLADLRYMRKYEAGNGECGDSGNKNGKKGSDTVIKVPPGTLVKDAGTGRVIVDMEKYDQEYIIAKGGDGGKGNQHYKNSVRQTPKFATPGAKGEKLDIVLELKSIADVGLVGYPNAGKSTFISAVTRSRPKIANYPFTTIEPNLGVVDLGIDRNFVIADIPGIIDGASKGVGLGLEFLRHVERTKLLFMVIDLSETDGIDVLQAYENLNRELGEYSERLSKRPKVIVGSKNDLTGTEESEAKLKERAAVDGIEFFSISAVSGSGVKTLLNRTFEKLSSLPKPIIFDPSDEMVVMKLEKTESFMIDIEEDVYVITGPLAEKIFYSVDFDDLDSARYFHRVMKSSGMIAELEKKGIREGDTVRICDMEFEYVR